MQKLVIPGAVLSLIALGAYFASNQDSYWWERGQPPSPSQLLTKAKQSYLETKAERVSRRKVSIEIFDMILAEMDQALAGNNSSDSTVKVAPLLRAGTLLRSLEGKLSAGSRVPLGELSSQLRVLISKQKIGEEVSLATLKLFTARLTYFFQRELPMPVPR